MIFFCILKIKICQKIETQIITVRRTVKLRYRSSVATLEVHKSEIEVRTSCAEDKTNKRGVNLEWFLTRRMNATTARVRLFTLSLPKIRAFFKKSSMFASRFLEDEER